MANHAPDTPLPTPTSPAEEVVIIVDRNNVVVGAEPRRVMRERRLIHRASYILVFNRCGELFIQKRTMNKDIYPGCWEVAAGGVMLAGESEDESARRELAEELGIHNVTLEFLFSHYYEAKENRVWGSVYRCTHDGPFVLQPEEVACGEFVTVEEVMRRQEREPFTPDGIEILARLIQGF